MKNTKLIEVEVTGAAAIIKKGRLCRVLPTNGLYLVQSTKQPNGRWFNIGNHCTVWLRPEEVRIQN